MPIVDIHGNPIKPAQLAEPQTARISTLRWEVAGHPSRGLTPAKLASIMSEAEQGNILSQCDLFEDMEEKDAHLYAELSKRRRSILGLEWTIAPPRGAGARDKKAAAQLEELVRSLDDFEEVLFDATDAIGKAFSCQEIRWERSEGQWWPQDIDARPQRWFTVPPFDRDDIRLRDPSEPYGAELWPAGWIVHRHRAKSGYITRAGLFRVLAWPYLFKNYSLRDLAEFLEIYGLPLRLGTYPSGASDQEKATLLKAVMAIGHSAAGIIPEGMAIDFQQAAEGSADPFKAMLEWCEAAESKAIVGQTLTAQPGARGGGSHAMAKVHDEVRWDITVSDARQLAGTLTRHLVYPLGALNGLIQDPRRVPRFIFDVSETEDITTYADALPKLVGIGMRIPEQWAHERLGIPEPGQDDAVLRSAPAAAPAPTPAGGAALKADPAAGPAAIPDDQTARLEIESEQAHLSLLSRIRAEVEAAADLPDLQRRLAAAFSEADAAALGKHMRLALAAAHLAGRYDIQQQAGGGA